MTTIEWVKNSDGSMGETWNPITGCSKISLGCAHCYAEKLSKRFKGRFGYPADEPFRPGTFHPEKLAKRFRPGQTVFVCSMGDFFHDAVGDDQKAAVYHVVEDNPKTTFIFLTKRPDNIARFWIGDRANAWIGVTCESNDYRWRIETLLKVSASVRFVSGEPMLGPLDIRKYLGMVHADDFDGVNYGEFGPWVDGIDWVICGGESGHGARMMHPDWARALRDQCVGEQVPFFFKQWGEWLHDSQIADAQAEFEWDYLAHCHSRLCPIRHDRERIYLVGKKNAGRLLDGVEHNEMPKRNY